MIVIIIPNKPENMTILLVTDIILEKDSLSPLLFAAEISLTALCEIPNPAPDLRRSIVLL